MDFGIERSSVILVLVVTPLAIRLCVRILACVDHAWAHFLFGGLAGVLSGLWVHALPCLSVRCDLSSLDNVPLRVALLCTAGPFAAAAVVTFVSNEYTKVPPVGLPYTVGVLVVN
jgi:hypothetical protein